MVGFVVSHELIPLSHRLGWPASLSWSDWVFDNARLAFALACSLLSLVYEITGDSFECLLEFFDIGSGYLAQ